MKSCRISCLMQWNLLNANNNFFSTMRIKEIKFLFPVPIIILTPSDHVTGVPQLLILAIHITGLIFLADFVRS